MDFSGQVVLVTGATGNLGRAVAESFGEKGAKLVLVGNTRASRVALGTGQDTLLNVDLRNRELVRAEFDKVAQDLGGFDVLCNIAGAFTAGKKAYEASAETWRAMFESNVMSIVNSSHAVVPHMLGKGRGKIVNVSAMAGLKGGAGMAAYSAAKSAVIRLTEAMSAELRTSAINVNCVLPSIIDTPENRRAMPKSDPSHWVSPRHIADVIVFLASDDACAVHGAAIPVTGLA